MLKGLPKIISSGIRNQSRFVLTDLFSHGELTSPSDDLLHGVYEIEDVLVPEDIETYKIRTLDKLRDIQNLCLPENVSESNFLQELDRIDDLSMYLSWILDACSCITMDCEPEYSQAAEKALDEVVKYTMELNNDRSTYDFLLQIQGFIDSGSYEVSDEEKKVVKDLISDLDITYSDNTEELISLSMHHSDCRNEIMFNPDVEDGVLWDMINTRRLIAEAKNFECFADHEFFSGSFAFETVAEVRDFLDEVSFFQEHFVPTTRSLFVRDNLDYTWSLHQVLNGLDVVTRDIFGFRLEPTFLSPYEDLSFSGNVRKMCCYDIQSDENLGSIYLLLDPNFSTSTTSVIRFGKKNKQLPLCVARCKTNGGEILDQYENPRLSLKNIKSIFHELGHCFQAILGTGNYQFCSGNRCGLDRIELSALFTGNLLENYEVFRHFFVEDGEKGFNNFLTEEEHRHLVDSEYFNKDIELMLKISKLFLLLHSHLGGEGYLENEEVTALLRKNRSYLASYGPSFYSYLYSHCIAAQAYCQYFRDDPFGKNDDEKKKEILRLLFSGGYVSSKELMEGICGGKVSPSYLFELNSL